MQDRNFDDLAAHFEQNIYRKQKGKLRQTIIWRDLDEVIPDLRAVPNKLPLRVLDVGAGLGQCVVALAQQGHSVTYNDISQEMHDRARMLASHEDEDVQSRITWHVRPYQALDVEPVDLLLCHAVIEWLASPHDLLPDLASRMVEGGYLSLCTYNPVGYTLRNLIAGNFKLLERDTVPEFKGSLTPTNPQSSDKIHAWLHDAGFEVVKQSGIRVFSDYAFTKRGGLEDEEAVMEKELAFSDQKPFYQIGRYVHIIAKKR